MRWRNKCDVIVAERSARRGLSISLFQRTVHRNGGNLEMALILKYAPSNSVNQSREWDTVSSRSGVGAKWMTSSSPLRSHHLQILLLIWVPIRFGNTVRPTFCHQSANFERSEAQDSERTKPVQLIKPYAAYFSAAAASGREVRSVRLGGTQAERFRREAFGTWPRLI